MNKLPYNNTALKRRIFEKILYSGGFLAIISVIGTLCILLYSIFSQGYTAFFAHYLEVNIKWDLPNNLENTTDNQLQELINNSIITSLKEKIPYEDIHQLTSFSNIISSLEINKLQNLLKENPAIIGTEQKYNLLLISNVDMLLKGYISKESTLLDQPTKSIVWALYDSQLIHTKFNWPFFKNTDSRDPEIAGIYGALMGSLYTVVLTIIFSVICGLGAAVYLEQYTKKSPVVSLIEANINNLAAVPSIVFGLLGLILFQNFFGVPRATPLLAALILTLMALPTIIISSRIALAAVPTSIIDAAYGLGSSKIQLIIHHLLPISLPGILTGIIISISRIVGESAPLLMIGMMAFVAVPPSSILSPTTVFPLQILLWTDTPEIGYMEKASATAMILLLFLFCINTISIYIRNKFE